MNKVIIGKFKKTALKDEYEYLDLILFLNKIRYYINNQKIILFYDEDNLYNFIINNLDSCISLTSQYLDEEIIEINQIYTIANHFRKIENILNFKLYEEDFKILRIKIENSNVKDEIIEIYKNYLKTFEYPINLFIEKNELFEYVFKELSIISTKSIDNKRLNYLNLLINLYNYIITCELDLEDEQIIDYKSKLLFEELYEYIYKAVMTINNKELINQFMWCIKDYCVTLLKKVNFYRLNNKEQELICKFYYLNLFFYNEVGNTIDNINEYSGFGNFEIYNYINGFKKNINVVRNNIKKDLAVWQIDNIKVSYDECIKDTKMSFDKLYESAYYLKGLMEYSPILKGMEYTPILVDIFKSIEELCCDLFIKLNLDSITKVNGKKLFFKNGNENIEFDQNREWIDKITLGNIEHLIYTINTNINFILTSDGIRKNISNAYNNSDVFTKKRMADIGRFNFIYGDKYNLKICGEYNSEKLRELFNLWIKECRNGSLHKNNTISLEKVNYCFGFTNLMIVLLLEWYSIIKAALLKR